MNYELAKELKDAGYPLIECDPGAKWNGGPFFKIDDIIYFSPRLEEIIEWCGDGFKNLERNTTTANVVWLCNNYLSEHSPLDEMTEGSTPTQAVARLWLVLRKKSTMNETNHGEN
jgi:hypothetical protein